MPRRSLQITTPDGTAPATLFTPEGATPQSAIILYMDVFGPRPGLAGMAGRMAAMGHAVLLPDLFYRIGSYGPFDAATAFDNADDRAWLRGMIGKTTQAMTEADTGAFLEALSAEGIGGPVGTVGYCMGGSRALIAAAAYPDRVVAAASIHGGNLASDAPDSPHLRAGQIRGRVYVGSAGTDRSFPPEQSARLAQALREAGVDHIIENYAGAEHGWAVPDHTAHNPAAAERHWLRLATFFGETL